MKLWISFFLYSALGFPLAASADIYQYMDQKGHTHLTSHKLGKGFKLISRIRSQRRSTSRFSKNKRRFSRAINRIAIQQKIDPALLHAIIRVESAYNPKALSPKGAAGLMQLMPATAKRYDVTDRWNPEQNINGGAKYLKFLLKRYNNNLALVAASYNAGEGAVDKYGKQVPPYRETKDYVKKVKKFYRKLGGRRYG